MKKKSRSTIKTIILAVFFAGIFLVYFNSLGNKSSTPRTDKQKTEIEQLCTYDMLGNYPKTPRDVVKLHSRYFKAFYGEKLSDDELYELNQQVRYLYSDDLITLNDETINLQSLKNSIARMEEQKYKYKSYELPEASQIKTYTQDGVYMATMEVKITIDMEDSIGYLYMQYVLVKENDKWKIQAWGESQLGK